MRFRLGVIILLLLSPAVAEAQVIEFRSPRYSVDEFVGPGVVTIVRSGDTSGTSSVTYVASAGLAQSPADFTSGSDTVTFDPGEMTKTFSVAIFDDPLWEDAESVNLTLNSPQGATLGTQSSPKLWIHPSDSPMAMHADFNGDGLQEILWRNRQTGATMFWYLDALGTGVVGSSPLFVVDPAFVVAGIDYFNDDKFADIVWYDGARGTTDIWIMQSGWLMSHVTYETMAYPWQIISTLDIDHDNDPDLTWRNVETGVIFSWHMDDGNVLRGSAARASSILFRIADEICYDGLNGIFQVGCAELFPRPAVTTMAYPWDVVAIRAYRPVVFWRNTSTVDMFSWYDDVGTIGTGLVQVESRFRLGATGSFGLDSRDTDYVWYDPDTGVTDIWIMQPDNTTIYRHRDYISFQRPWDTIAPHENAGTANLNR